MSLELQGKKIVLAGLASPLVCPVAKESNSFCCQVMGQVSDGHTLDLYNRSFWCLDTSDVSTDSSVH